uniref:Uncharacterized protein n=1 Tax=Rhizophora mucronata TaxID=61149 RepID=A0A2P2NC93_RHIMU
MMILYLRARLLQITRGMQLSSPLNLLRSRRPTLT